MAIIGGIGGYVIPSYWGWTTYTPVIPKLYWDVYSQEERIKRLCLEYDKLTHYASMIADEINQLSDSVDDTLDDFTKKITKQLKEQNDTITAQIEAQNNKVDNQLVEMKVYIDEKFREFDAGAMTYDVTTGTYRPSYQAMRRLFQALSYDHKGLDQLVSFYADNKTVEQLAEQTVYNAAYSQLPTIVIDDQISIN